MLPGPSGTVAACYLIAVGSCLDDVSVLALLEGRLPAASLAEAEAHLDRCASCRAILVGVAQLGSSSDEGRIGRYLVLDRLARGGFGDVLRGYDPGLDRRVAIKRLHVDLREAFRTQLETEARAMAKLSHPHVVTVYEVGTDRGVLFIAMELVEGVTLREWLEECRSTADILSVFHQVGAGLAAAHAAGIVHGDVKPENVLVGHDGRARVTDFGLARGGERPAFDAKVDAGDGSASVMLAGRIVGTPAYMAPEQLAGGSATPASDQYAFCVALVEALEGARPFAAANLEALTAQAADRQFVAPSSWARHRARAITRGLANDPDARFDQMSHLLAALRERPRGARRRTLAVGMSLAMGALGLGVAIASQPAPCSDGATLAGETWNPDRRAQLENRFTKAAARLAPGAVAELSQALDAWRSQWGSRHREQCLARRNGGDEAMARATRGCLRRQRREVDALLDALAEAGPAMVARVPEALASLPQPESCEGAIAPSPGEGLEGFDEGLARTRAALATGDYTAAEAMAAKLRAQALNHDPSVAVASLALGEAQLGRGRYEEAETTTLEALWAARRSRDEATAAMAWLQRAAIAGTAGRDQVTEEACRHAEAVASRLGRPRVEARIHNALGVLYTNLGRFDEAKRELETALRLRREIHGREHPEVARTHTNLGNLARSRGDLVTARRHHEEARSIDRARLGESHPNEARHLHNLARITLLEGDAKRAEKLYLRALASRRGTLGPKHPEVGVTLNSLGLLYERTGDRDRARSHYDEAIALLSETRPRDAALARENRARLDEAPSVDLPATHRPARPRPVEAQPPPKPAPAPPRPVSQRPAAPPPPGGGSYLPGQAWD